MQIVIDIPNSIYANLSKIVNGSIASKRILDCVKNGTPLPKGHGALIDVDALVGKIHGVRSISAVIDAPTIIPAERSDNE